MKTTKGIVTLTIDVECPYCGHFMDVLEQEQFLLKGNTLPDPDKVYREEFWCTECNEEFMLNELEY